MIGLVLIFSFFALILFLILKISSIQDKQHQQTNSNSMNIMMKIDGEDKGFLNFQAFTQSSHQSAEWGKGHYADFSTLMAIRKNQQD